MVPSTSGDPLFGGPQTDSKNLWFRMWGKTGALTLLGRMAGGATGVSDPYWEFRRPVLMTGISPQNVNEVELTLKAYAGGVPQVVSILEVYRNDGAQCFYIAANGDAAFLTSNVWVNAPIVLGGGGVYDVQIGRVAANVLGLSAGDTLQFGLDTTGAGVALLGANCPAGAVAAPYTWIQVISSDGSTVYIPAWK